MKSEHTRGKKFTQIHIQINGRNNQSKTKKKELISSNSSSSVQTWRASGPNFKLCLHFTSYLKNKKLHILNPIYYGGDYT